MIWPKKASIDQHHIGIVRANKREVNDYFSGGIYNEACEVQHKLHQI
jgi:hypothetical protein